MPTSSNSGQRQRSAATNIEADTIIGFSAAGGDFVDLETFGLADFSQLQPYMSQAGNDVVIALNGTDNLTLQNVQLNTLTASHFRPGVSENKAGSSSRQLSAGKPRRYLLTSRPTRLTLCPAWLEKVIGAPYGREIPTFASSREMRYLARSAAGTES